MSLVVGLLVVVAAVHPRHERGYENPQITTVQDGKVWLFGVIEHWNAEALGWHVAKRCDHYAAVPAPKRPANPGSALAAEKGC